MDLLFSLVLPLLAIICIGFIARRKNFLSEEGFAAISKFAFYFALTALVFKSIYSSDFQKIFSVWLVVGFLAATLAVLVLVWLLTIRMPSNDRGTVLVQAYHGNLAYFGLPIAAAALGEIGAAKTAILLGFGAVFQTIATTAILASMCNGKSKKFSTAATIKDAGKNPLIAAILAGFAVSIANFQLPETIIQIVSTLAATALPLSLVGIGASINTGGIRKHLKRMPLISISKLALSPALGFLLFSMAFKLPKIDIAAGTLLLAMPPAVSTFLYTKELGGNTELTASSISFNTILSLITIPAIIFLLSA